MIRNKIERITKTTGKESTKGNSPTYRAIEDIVKQAVNHGAVDNFISSGLKSLTESQEVTQNIVVCLIKTPIFTASIAKPVKTDAEIAVMNEAKLYDPNSNTGTKKDEKAPPSSLT